MKSFYEITYRHFRAPWDIGPRNELVALVESERLKHCRAFAKYFEIEKIAGELDWSKFPPGFAAYLMTRKEDGM